MIIAPSRNTTLIIHPKQTLANEQITLFRNGSGPETFFALIRTHASTNFEALKPLTKMAIAEQINSAMGDFSAPAANKIYAALRQAGEKGLIGGAALLGARLSESGLEVEGYGAGSLQVTRENAMGPFLDFSEAIPFTQTILPQSSATFNITSRRNLNLNVPGNYTVATLEVAKHIL